MAFGSNSADLYTSQGDDDDADFAQEASISSQPMRQWRLRVVAQEETFKDLAYGKSRRLLAHNQPSQGAEIEVGNSVIFSSKLNGEAPQNGDVRLSPCA